MHLPGSTPPLIRPPSALPRTGRHRRAARAAGYQQTPRGWKLIATERIGDASEWSWYATDVSTLTVTQLKPLPSSSADSDTITVSCTIRRSDAPQPSL